MGLKTESRGQSGNFVKVKYGSLVLVSDGPKEGYEEFEVTNPQTNLPVTKYIQRFGALEGRIVNMDWYDTGEEYSNRFMGIKFKLRDSDGEVFFLDLQYSTKPYNTFTKVMENIDFEKDVEFNVWVDKKTDKTAFLVRQDNKPIKWKYTKENPGDCPPPRAKKPTGFDFTEQNEWLFEKLTLEIIPHVKQLNPGEEFDEDVPEYTGLGEEVDAEVVKDSIPFLNKAQNDEYDKQLKQEKAATATAKPATSAKQTSGKDSKLGY